MSPIFDGRLADKQYYNEYNSESNTYMFIFF